jgi:hypothetical protein
MEGNVMNGQIDKMREIVSILMESDLYFDFPLEERRQIVLRIIACMGRA